MRLGLLLLLVLAGVDTSQRRSNRNLLPRGHTLVVYYKGIVELDGGGREVWRYRYSHEGIRSAQLLADNTFLVLDGQQKKLLIVDRKGQTLWQRDVASQHLFHGAPAADGTFWAAGRRNNQGFLERVDRNGEIRQQLEVSSLLTFQVLRDGHLLVNQHEQRTVTEVDRTGMKIWEWKDVEQDYGVERLSNGHTLIGRSSDVIEVDREGRTVWTCTSRAGKYHYAIKRLRNGRTLMAGLQGTLVEVDKEGRETWRYEDKEFQSGSYPGPMYVDRGE